MARIRDKAVTIYSTSTTSMVCNMPTHVSGDLLVAFVSKDLASAFTTPSGWDAIRTVISLDAAGGVYTRFATSSSETVTFTLASAPCCAVILSISGAEAQVTSTSATINVSASGSTYTRTTGNFVTDGFKVGQTVIMSGFTNAGNNGPKFITAISGPSNNVLTVTSQTALVDETGDGNEAVRSTGLDATAAAASDTTTNPLAGIGLTTVDNNCLVLHGLPTDIGANVQVLPPWVNVFPIDTGANALSTSYTFRPTAGSVSAPSHWAGIISGVDGRAVAVAVRDNGGGSRPAYIPLSTTPSVQISPLCGLSAVDRGAWIAAAQTAITSIGGKPVTGVAISNTADVGYNPFRAAASTPGTSSTTNLSHTEFDLTASENVGSTGLLFGTWKYGSPRDYLDTGSPGQGGVYILAGSNTTNYRVWTVGGQFTKDTSPDRQPYLIEVGTSDTAYASLGTPDWTALDYFAFGSAGFYGAPITRWSNLFRINEVVVAGGSSATEIGFDDVIEVVNNGSGYLPLVDAEGSVATVWCPIRFGGTDRINVSMNLRTIQYPTRADNKNFTQFHVSNNRIGVEFYGLNASDSFKFTNCLFTSASPYYWRFNSSHSSAATLDFTGSTVINATVTLRSTVTLNRVTFIDCPSFTQNQATITNCTFRNTRVTSTIAGVSNINNSSFISSGTGHAIEITGSPGNATLTSVTFTGYSGTSTNAAIFVNTSAGTVNLTIAGGGTIPSIRVASGVTVNLIVTTTLTLTNIKNPSEVVIIDSATRDDTPPYGTPTILDNAENVTTGTYSFNVNAATYPLVDAHVFAIGHLPVRLLDIDMSTNRSIPISQFIDRQYHNP